MFTVVLSLVLVAFEGETFLASVLAAVLVLLLASFVAVILLNLLICEFSLPRTPPFFLPINFIGFADYGIDFVQRSCRRRMSGFCQPL